MAGLSFQRDPFPLPLAGNLLLFRKNMFAHDIMNELGKEYGHMYTLFLGHLPSVVVTDPEVVLQVLKKQLFAGRPHIEFMDWLFRNDSIDMIFADFGKEFEAVKKVGHNAARKYATSSQLSTTVTDVVDRIIDRVKEEPFDSNEHFSLTMIAILAQAAFGKKYEFEDPEFLRWKTATDSLQQTNRIRMIIMFVPFLRHVFRRTYQEFLDTVNYQMDFIELMYQRAEENYTEGKNETFCDAIITAKREAETEENWLLPFLKPQNMYNVVSDLFSAGTDTTRNTLCWIFIFMAKYPDMQDKMRKEVADVTQGKTVHLDDKTKCNFVRAFINESMRFRPLVPFGLPHKATVDAEIDGHMIPKGTTVVVSLFNALQHEATWGDPEVFRPDRFQHKDGTFVSKPNHLFIPFSEGRRSCPGNQLALNNLFLIVARFLQRTTNIEIVGGVTDDHMKGDIMKTNGFLPIEYRLRLTLMM